MEKYTDYKEIGRRIEQRRKELGLTLQDLGSEVDLSASTIQRYEKGLFDKIKLPIIEAIADALNVNPEWLAGETDDPIKYDDGELLASIPLTYMEACNGDAKKAYQMMRAVDRDAFNEPPVSVEAFRLAKDFDTLDTWGQKQVRSTADIEVARVADERSRETSLEDKGANNVTRIPFRCSTQSASAGTGTYLGPDSFEIIYVPDIPMARQASFGVPVRGDSMEPMYHDEDILMVQSAEEIDIGEIGIFTIDGQGYVKKLGDGELISLNPAYDPIPMNESIRCHGRVLGVLDPAWITEA